jgi:hypothetical protein
VGALVVQFLLWILSAFKNKIRGIYGVAFFRRLACAGCNDPASAVHAAKCSSYLLSWQLCLFSLFLNVFPQLRFLQGKTALLQAVDRGDVAMVQELVAAKANLEAKTSDVGLSFAY